MAFRAAEQSLPVDMMSAGDSAIGHSLEQAAEYRAATADARARAQAGLPPAEAITPAPAPVQPDRLLPMLGVAEQAKGRKLRDLESARHRLEVKLSQGMVGINGTPLSQFPGLVAMREQDVRGLQLLTDQIEQIRGLDGDALRSWAADQGYQ